MIVRDAPDAFHLITQPDHARLAREVMERCVRLREHPRRDAILLATAEHDSGWAEADLAPTVNASGEVVDFVRAPLYVRQDTSLVGIERLSATPWAAALVAQHRLEVYSRFSGDPEWRLFFREVEELREEHLIESGGTLADLIDDYLFVRLGDLISLAFCTGWARSERVNDYVITLSGDNVLVSPDLFGGETVPMSIEAREISRRPYSADADLLSALAQAPRVTLTGHATGATHA